MAGVREEIKNISQCKLMKSEQSKHELVLKVYSISSRIVFSMPSQELTVVLLFVVVQESSAVFRSHRSI